jgi:hypothetical protein
MTRGITRLFAFLVIARSPASAAEWYENLSQFVNDPFQFDNQRGVPFHNGLRTTA